MYKTKLQHYESTAVYPGRYCILQYLKSYRECPPLRYSSRTTTVLCNFVREYIYTRSALSGSGSNNRKYNVGGSNCLFCNLIGLPEYCSIFPCSWPWAPPTSRIATVQVATIHCDTDIVDLMTLQGRMRVQSIPYSCVPADTPIVFIGMTVAFLCGISSVFPVSPWMFGVGLAMSGCDLMFANCIITKQQYWFEASSHACMLKVATPSYGNSVNTPRLTLFNWRVLLSY